MRSARHICGGNVTLAFTTWWERERKNPESSERPREAEPFGSCGSELAFWSSRLWVFSTKTTGLEERTREEVSRAWASKNWVTSCVKLAPGLGARSMLMTQLAGTPASRELTWKMKLRCLSCLMGNIGVLLGPLLSSPIVTKLWKWCARLLMEEPSWMLSPEKIREGVDKLSPTP